MAVRRRGPPPFIAQVGGLSSSCGRVRLSRVYPAPPDLVETDDSLTGMTSRRIKATSAGPVLATKRIENFHTHPPLFCLQQYVGKLVKKNELLVFFAHKVFYVKYIYCKETLVKYEITTRSTVLKIRME